MDLLNDSRLFIDGGCDAVIVKLQFDMFFSVRKLELRGGEMCQVIIIY